MRQNSAALSVVRSLCALAVDKKLGNKLNRKSSKSSFHDLKRELEQFVDKEQVALAAPAERGTLLGQAREQEALRRGLEVRQEVW